MIMKNDRIAHENISPKFMIANHHLAKSASDRAWSDFFRKLIYKAGWYGKKIITYPTENNSQRCSECHKIVPKTLNERWHICDNLLCKIFGISIDRDHNAARDGYHMAFGVLPEIEKWTTVGQTAQGRRGIGHETPEEVSTRTTGETKSLLWETKFLPAKTPQKLVPTSESYHPPL